MRRLWRLLFVASGVLILAGGPRHPNGTLEEMLAHPDWVLSHALMLAAFVSLMAGLVLYLRQGPLPPRTRRWTRWAIVGSALQSLEMAFHTASVVDLSNFRAAEATPVLTAHLWMIVFLQPLFALTVIGLVVATARERSLGSLWIAWIGILGALAHGLAPVLVVGFDLGQFAVLFPGVVLLAVWLVLAGVWPLRAAARRANAMAGAAS